MPPAHSTPQIGDTVLCDGRRHTVIDPVPVMGPETAARFLAGGKILYEDAQFRIAGSAADLHWDDELGCWYLWGRCLSKADRVLVAELRDRGVLPARRRRMPGSVPAGGEHLELYKALVHGKPAGFMKHELVGVRRGDDPSPALKAACTAAAKCRKKLAHGYADPNDGDPSGEEG